MANSPDLQMRDLICERDQLLKNLASRNSMLDRLNASNERLTAENAALKLRLQRMREPVSDEEYMDMFLAMNAVNKEPGKPMRGMEVFNAVIATRAAKE